jgi:hypothetical protein
MEGTIDQLNFEVILDDKKFTKAIEKDLEAANELNVKLSTVLNLKKKLNSETARQAINAEKVRTAEAKAEEAAARAALAQQKVATEMERTRAAAEGYAGAVGTANTQLTSTSNIMRTISQLTGVVFGVAGLRRFMSSLIDITGQFEVQRMALRNMLQDVDGADKIFQDLYQFSSDSTYRFSELAKYAKQLAAFDIGKDSLLETTKMLGDVASGVGVSMDRLILAYGHVKSSGFLRGIQLRSFSQNGVPVLEELSRMFTEIEGKAVSLGDVFDKMMKREIPFEMVEQAFQRMTSEGGKFYQMQEVLAKTLAGQINILKGRWENMLAAVGNANSGILKNTVSAISEAISNYENFGKYLKELIAAFGVYQVTLISATAATKGFASALNVGLLGTLKRIALALAANPYALLAAGVTAATMAVYELNNKLTEAEKIQQVVAKGATTYSKNLAEEVKELDRMYTKLGLLTKGTQEYDSAKRAIETRFGPYIQELQNEGKAVTDLASSYELLRGKIEASARARALETQTQDLKSQFDKSTSSIEKQFYKSIKKVAENLSGAETEILSSYVYGLVDSHDPEMKSIYKKLLDEFGAGKTTKVFGDLAELKKEYKDAFESYNAGVDTIAERYEKLEEIASEGGKKVEKNLEGWRKSVGDITAGLSDKTLQDTGLVAKEDEDYYEYLERIGKKYKELREEKDKALKVNKGQYDEWINAIKRVDTALEGNILSDERYNKSPWKSDSETNKALKETISDMKERVSILEKYKKAYDSLYPVFGEETQTQMEKIFGAGTDYTTLETQIDAVTSSLRKLGKEGIEAAEVIETRLGTDAVSKILKAQKDLEQQQKKQDKWEKTLRKWEKDWGGEYSGFEDDLDKVVRDYNNERKKIDDEYADALKELRDAHEGNAEAIWEEKKKLDALYEARKKSAQNKAQNNVVAEAEKYVKDQTDGMDLSHWGDKSIKQVYDMWKDISRMAAETPEIDEELKGRLYRAGLTLKEFREQTEKEWEKLSYEVQVELGKKAAVVLRDFGDTISDVAGKVAELASLSGRDGLADFANELAEISKLASDVGAKLAEGNYLEAVVSYGAHLAKSFFEAATASARLRRSIAETAEEARRQSFSDNLEKGVNSIFGTDDMSKVNNAIANIKELRKAVSGDRAQADADIQTKQGAKWYDWILGGFKPGGILNQLLNIAKGSSEFENLSGMASKIGMSLYDEYGNLNADTLQAILDTYEDLRQADKEWIQSAINNSEAYAEAMEQLDGVMESLFGDIATSATDAIVNGWLEAQSAALDYADILDDVAQSYAKMLIKSMILDEVLNEDAVKAVKEAFVQGDSVKAMALVEENLQKIADMEPVFQQVMEGFEPYFNREGSGTSGSTSSGIKSITEDTANLLASYINAMRADLSVVRAMQTVGWQDVKAIREAVQGQYTPNYNEYMAQIAANTYDMAQSNMEILSRIKSVITPSPSGGSAVRTSR